MDVTLELPERRGSRPTTSSTFPHRQLDQQPDGAAVREDVARRAFALDGVVEGPSLISVPGARGLFLDEGCPTGPTTAFLREREFAHLHPDPDWSLHLALPDETADLAIDRGWAELHLVARTPELPGSVVLVYAPRDHEEAEVVLALLEASRDFAVGG